MGPDSRQARERNHGATVDAKAMTDLAATIDLERYTRPPRTLPCPFKGCRKMFRIATEAEVVLVHVARHLEASDAK